MLSMVQNPKMRKAGCSSIFIPLSRSMQPAGRYEDGFFFFLIISYIGCVFFANRTIMALWRTRALSPDEKAEIAVEQEQDGNSGLLEDSGSFLMVEDAKMTKVYSMELRVNVSRSNVCVSTSLSFS